MLYKIFYIASFVFFTVITLGGVIMWSKQYYQVTNGEDYRASGETLMIYSNFFAGDAIESVLLEEHKQNPCRSDHHILVMNAQNSDIMDTLTNAPFNLRFNLWENYHFCIKKMKVKYKSSNDTCPPKFKQVCSSRVCAPENSNCPLANLSFTESKIGGLVKLNLVKEELNNGSNLMPITSIDVIAQTDGQTINTQDFQQLRLYPLKKFIEENYQVNSFNGDEYKAEFYGNISTLTDDQPVVIGVIRTPKVEDRPICYNVVLENIRTLATDIHDSTMISMIVFAVAFVVFIAGQIVYCTLDPKEKNTPSFIITLSIFSTLTVGGILILRRMLDEDQTVKIEALKHYMKYENKSCFDNVEVQISTHIRRLLEYGHLQFLNGADLWIVIALIVYCVAFVGVVVAGWCLGKKKGWNATTGRASTDGLTKGPESPQTEFRRMLDLNNSNNL